MDTRLSAGTAGQSRPSSTVTFLFSDIEGSTERWERDSEAMSTALARHDKLVREAIERHGGHVFKTVGDAFCAAFGKVEESAAAAIDVQKAMHAEDFSLVQGLAVRTALHTGTADERAGDYFGPAVNRVARMLSAAHGAQILVSAATAELLGRRREHAFVLRDLGMHRLRDLARGEHIYQLSADGLPDVFPALRSAEDFPNNLPRRLTSFVGREAVMAEIETLIARSVLVTIVGSGGVGKTTCALQAGFDLLQSFADGVWMVELAPAGSTSQLSAAIAKALNIRESPYASLTETLTAYLKRKTLLLILDNCEHLLEGVRTAASHILRSCRGVKILATSRERLQVQGESVYRMPSLAVSGAMKLFADRARAVDGRFTLSDANAADVEAICRDLDGIPLALELAAARVKVLSPKQLRERLNQRFRILTGGDTLALPRHQTMRALLDWSYDLLSEPERRLFRKLAVFNGGFTLECAHAVFASSGGDDLETLDLLSSLVEKSVVQAEPSIGGETRYNLLESTRQYAREKIAAHGELHEAAAAHAGAYLNLADKLEQEFERLPDTIWNSRVEAEIPNWLSALEWTLGEERDVLMGQRLAGALCDVWRTFDRDEGTRWTGRARQFLTEATPNDVVARLDLTDAVLKGTLSEYKASYAAARRASVQYEHLNNDLALAWSRLTEGSALAFMGKVDEGIALLHEVLESAHRLGVRSLLRAVLCELGNAYNVAGDLATCRIYFAEALTLYHQTGSQRGVMAVTAALAEAEFAAGDASSALASVAKALDDVEPTAERHSFGAACCNAAAYAIALDRFDEGLQYALRALEILRDLHGEIAVIFTLQHIAAARVLSKARAPGAWGDDVKCAVSVLGYVDARLAANDSEREYTERQEHERVSRILGETFDADTLRALRASGERWDKDSAIGSALALG